MARTGLRVLLVVLGLVALVFGTLSVLFGADLVLGVDRFPPSLDSELRFYAAWYVLAGVLVLRASRRVELETFTIRAVCAVLFVAGLARVLSIVAVGTPRPLYVALMIVELVLPLVIVPWHAAVARGGDRSTEWHA